MVTQVGGRQSTNMATLGPARDTRPNKPPVLLAARLLGCLAAWLSWPASHQAAADFAPCRCLLCRLRWCRRRRLRGCTCARKHPEVELCLRVRPVSVEPPKAPLPLAWLAGKARRLASRLTSNKDASRQLKEASKTTLAWLSGFTR